MTDNSIEGHRRMVDSINLMLAGPDLLEACMAARHYINRESFDVEEYEHIKKKLDAAITKAKKGPE